MVIEPGDAATAHRGIRRRHGRQVTAKAGTAARIAEIIAKNRNACGFSSSRPTGRMDREG
jgi:hypothetical protein